MLSIGLRPLRLLSRGIGLTTALAAALAAATLWFGARERDYQRAVHRTLAAQTQIAEVSRHVLHVETSQRGYLYTGRAIYLDDYKGWIAALPTVLDKVERLMADSPQQKQNLASLRRAVADRVDELRTTIDEQKAGRADAARALVDSDLGLQLMDKVRKIVSEMGSEEDRLFSARESALQTVGTLSDIGAGTAFLMICGIGALVTIYTQRSFEELTTARDQLVMTNELLADEAQQRKQSNARLQLAMDAAQLGSWQYDPLHRAFTGDIRCHEIFNVAEREAPVEEIMKLVSSDDAGRVRAALDAALDPANPRRSAAEFRLQRRNGGVRWVETLGLACFEGTEHEQRAVHVVGTVQDVTERKERDEKEHLLMREISHRAKNMLSVVHAIAQQTSTQNPEDFVERFGERIQALAANQDLLVKNDWKGADIGDLVCAQLAPFSDLFGSRIVLHDPKLRLNAASAQGIGLALHELATNAGKYGALSTDAGRVEVAWNVDGETFTVSWVETGGPPVSTPQRRGFGTLVMEAMVERSVGGTVVLEYPPSGVTWRLTCPAVNARER